MLIQPADRSPNQSNIESSEINIAATDQSGNLRKMQEMAAAYGGQNALATLHS